MQPKQKQSDKIDYIGGRFPERGGNFVVSEIETNKKLGLPINNPILHELKRWLYEQIQHH